VVPLLLGGLIFACEFTTNLDPLKNGDCGALEKPCTDPETGGKKCVSKNDPATGCFSSTLSPTCSSCGQLIVHATPACSTDFAKCIVGTCDTGWFNCDPNADGCTTNLEQDVNNCNNCGHVCSIPAGLQMGATAACQSAHCTYTCNIGWADCDMMASTGCECQGTCNGTACVKTDGGL
jgi:hypothetical protein